MSTPRLYCPAKLAPGAHLPLPAGAAHHAARVLRMQAGDDIILFNGDGQDYPAEIQRVTRDAVFARVRACAAVARESPLHVTLAQAISAGERMDFTLQKAVELGVGAIQPLAAERSVVKLAGERAEKRRTHWQNVVIAACEQSGRAVVPQVAAARPLLPWLSEPQDYPVKLMLSPDAAQTLHDLPPPRGPVAMLIGCEGGFASQERAAALQAGYLPVRLGARVLRTETAALAALAALQTLWGDF